MSKTQEIAGIDPSLTNTAMFFGPGEFREIKGGKLRGAERLHTMYNHILEALEKYRPRVVCIEGYAFGARARQHRLGEIGGIVRLACVQAGVQYIYEIPPTSLKKWFTGDGRASKEEMQEEAAERQLFKAYPSNDLADACALWYAAQDSAFLRAKCEEEVLRG